MPKRLPNAYSEWSITDLKEARTLLGLTKRKLSEKLGVSERQYSYYESGEIKIDKKLEFAICWIKHTALSTSAEKLELFRAQQSLARK